MTILESVKKIGSKKIGSKKSGASTKKETARIQELAYLFYIEGGRKEGNHENDWLRAEAVVHGKQS